MTPAALARDIHDSFLLSVDAAFAQGQRRFFQDEVDTYGVRTADLNRIVREVYREVKPWPWADLVALSELLWSTGKLESGVCVCHLLRRFSRRFAAPEFKLFESWIDRHVRNWAHCDGVSTWLLAGAIANAPDLSRKLVAWTRSRNRWKRRAAAVALLQEAKQGRQTEFIFDQAERLFSDRDDMVQKGVGWLLKETYPARPAETLEFLTTRAAGASRLTLRYAAEKMTPAARAAVLAR